MNAVVEVIGDFVVVVLNVVWAIFEAQFKVVQDCLSRADNRSGLARYTELGRLNMMHPSKAGKRGSDIDVG